MTYKIIWAIFASLITLLLISFNIVYFKITNDLFAKTKQRYNYFEGNTKNISGLITINNVKTNKQKISERNKI